VLDVRLGSARGVPAVLAIPVPAAASGAADDAAAASTPGTTAAASTPGTTAAASTRRTTAAASTPARRAAAGAASWPGATAAASTAPRRAAARATPAPSTPAAAIFDGAIDDSRLAAGTGPEAAVAAGTGPEAALDLLPEADRAEAAAFLEDVKHKGKAGKVHELPRPARRPQRWLFVGIGDGDDAGWRSAGAALARKASKQPALTILLPATIQPDEVGALAEGLWLASYRYRLGADDPDSAPKLRRVALVVSVDPSPGITPAAGSPLGGPAAAGPPAATPAPAGGAKSAAGATPIGTTDHAGGATHAAAGSPAADATDAPAGGAIGGAGTLADGATHGGSAGGAGTVADGATHGGSAGGAGSAPGGAARRAGTPAGRAIYDAASSAGGAAHAAATPARGVAADLAAAGTSGKGAATVLGATGTSGKGAATVLGATGTSGKGAATVLAAAATPAKDAVTVRATVRGAADASGGAAGAGAGRQEFEAALAKARVVVEATALARDLTNTPSARKTPAWMGRQIQKAASGITNLSVSVREPAALATEGFNGILAVGSGSANPPRLVELSWRPRGARRHVVLIGKGITFDTGGVCIKTRPGMKLMRKDMGGAAAVLAATLAAGTLRLPIRITALAPLAENSLGADSYRPGDVIRHYGGQTSEITNTDAEGRVVLADAIAYAVRRLRPDLIVDMATLTGAQGVALGKRTAAIFSDSDALAKDLQDAGEAIGESIWRMPLPDDYLEALSSDVADRVNATDIGAGAVLAALYLREFTGSMRDSWAHIDMSSPAWSETNDGETVKGATGWGVRTLLRWLESVAA